VTDSLALLRRIRDDQSWRTNDNALWSDILACIATMEARATNAVSPMDDDARVPDDYRNQAIGYRAGWNDRHEIAMHAAEQTVNLSAVLANHAEIIGEIHACLAAAPHESFPASQVRGWMTALDVSPSATVPAGATTVRARRTDDIGIHEVVPQKVSHDVCPDCTPGRGAGGPMIPQRCARHSATLTASSPSCDVCLDTGYTHRPSGNHPCWKCDPQAVQASVLG